MALLAKLDEYGPGRRFVILLRGGKVGRLPAPHSHLPPSPGCSHMHPPAFHRAFHSAGCMSATTTAPTASWSTGPGPAVSRRKLRVPSHPACLSSAVQFGSRFDAGLLLFHSSHLGCPIRIGIDEPHDASGRPVIENVFRCACGSRTADTWAFLGLKKTRPPVCPAAGMTVGPRSSSS